MLNFAGPIDYAVRLYVAIMMVEFCQEKTDQILFASRFLLY